MNSKQLIKLLKKDAWLFIRQKGSHAVFKHSVKSGILVIPDHGSKDLQKGTELSILKKAGLK